MTILDQIRALKPGDRVKVTFEDVVTSTSVGLVSTEKNWAISDIDGTITAIEVIERPLAVGDQVVIPGVIRGVVRAIADERAMVLWDDGSYGLAFISDLRRVTP